MSQIDDPYSVIRAQFPEAGPLESLFSSVIKLAGPFAPVLGTLGAALERFCSAKEQSLRIQALFEATEYYVKSHDAEFAQIKERLKELPSYVSEAILVAIDESRRTADEERIRRIGSVVGSGLANRWDKETWDRVSTYILQLSELNDADIQALTVLYDHQKDCFRQQPTRYNDFAPTMRRILEYINAAQINREEFYSRCGRLQGYGLTLSIPSRPDIVGPDEFSFRITDTGKSLIEILKKR